MMFDMASLLTLEAKTENKETLTVTCLPDLNDPTIVQRQNRAVCLTQPYPACPSCPHSKFTLSFKDKEERLTQVACPRWKSEGHRLEGEAPEYVATEESTCEKKPFLFCASCPSRKELADTFSTDKRAPGWYGRWNRLTKEESEDDRR